MDLGGLSWGLQTIIGVALLAAILLWAVLRNKSSAEDEQHTEDATRRLYEEEDAEHGHESDDMP